MDSRLDVLLRQRRLLDEHLCWLDDEIAQERLRSGHAPQRAAVAAPAVIASAPLATEGFGEPDVKGLHTEVRRGCLLYFLIAAAVLGGLVAFIYWKYSGSAGS